MSCWPRAAPISPAQPPRPSDHDDRLPGRRRARRPGPADRPGRQLLGDADVIVHDRLADAGLLELAPAGAERIDVGKAPGGPVDQDAINTLLVRHGRAGRKVVRLKGGDPFVFGRGGEEILALQAAGVPYEVVPGITSAIAVPAYAGVPVTHRGLATSFTVVTGHSRHAVDRDTNWEALAAAGGTLVVLMGVAHRAAIASRLLAAGMAAATPVLAVRWGTRSEQRSIRIRLDELGATPLEPPVTLVVGPVAGLELDWYERRPLFGRQVVVTRARSQASTLSALLRDLGARAIEVPTIRIDPPADGGAGLDRAARELAEGRYDWVVFSSANAVEALLARLRDARSFGPARIAAIGPGTADALAQWRLTPDLMPGPGGGRGSAGGVSRPTPARVAGADPASCGRTGRAARWAGRRRDGRSTPSPPTGPSRCRRRPPSASWWRARMRCASRRRRPSTASSPPSAAPAPSRP